MCRCYFIGGDESITHQTKAEIIHIRTFVDASDKPGFLEIDLVAHCGNSTRGEYINTLNMTDIATGWTVSTSHSLVDEPIPAMLSKRIGT